MYAVIRTGGKQYRVQPGDLLVVEKLDGDVGAELSFGEVLLVGGDAGEVTVGAPTVDGAVVRATLIETRKGEKVKIFKKIRRQGYRRTRGHRQLESVLRVTALEGVGLNAKWDGTVDLTPRSVLNARARGLAPRGEAVEIAQPAAAPAPAVAEEAPKKPRRSAKTEAAAEAQAAAEVAPTPADAPLLADVVEPAAEAAPKKTRARKPKAETAAPEGEGGEG
jgi:large subunit ribosomal protein L21